MLYHLLRLHCKKDVSRTFREYFRSNLENKTHAYIINFIIHEIIHEKESKKKNKHYNKKETVTRRISGVGDSMRH